MWVGFLLQLQRVLGWWWISWCPMCQVRTTWIRHVQSFLCCLPSVIVTTYHWLALPSMTLTTDTSKNRWASAQLLTVMAQRGRNLTSLRIRIRKTALFLCCSSTVAVWEEDHWTMTPSVCVRGATKLPLLFHPLSLWLPLPSISLEPCSLT